MSALERSCSRGGAASSNPNTGVDPEVCPIRGWASDGQISTSTFSASPLLSAISLYAVSYWAKGMVL